MSVRAKMKCARVTEYASYPGQKEITLEAVHGPGNEGWSKFTPSGEVRLNVTNPEASEQFKVGAVYFVDFTPAD